MTTKRGIMPRRLKRVFNTGLSLVAAFGIVLGVMEYRQRGALAQAQQTMNMIDVWELRGARDAFRDLSTALEQMIEADVSDAEREAARTNRQDYERLRKSLSRAILRKDGQMENFEEVVYFFTRLSLCIEAGLCDAKAAKTFFGDTLNSFLLVFRPSIAARNAANGTTDDPLIALQTRFGRLE